MQSTDKSVGTLSMYQVCKHCEADLSKENSVRREYVNKDGGDSVYAYGRYDANGYFESDRFGGFGDGRFDLLDDSDSCESCEEIC